MLTERDIAAIYQSLFGMSPRETDIFMLRVIGPTPANVAVYLWEYMGKPRHLMPSRILREIKFLMEELHET